MRTIKADTGHDADAILLLVSEQESTLLSTRLGEVGWQVLLARGPDEAVRLLHANEQIRIAIIDEGCGELDALDTARAVQQRVRSRQLLTLLLVTQGDLQSMLVRASGFGALDVLAKPVPVGLLRAKLCALLEMSLRLSAIERREARIAELERAALGAGPHPSGTSAGSRAASLQAIEELRRELQLANRTREEFLAIISHELRTPLNAILGWTQILRTHPFDEPGLGRALSTIERNAKFQAKLIDDLLDFSRMLSGRLRLEERRIDLGSVVDSAIEALGPAIRAKNLRLRQSIDRSLPETIGDPVRLQQVVCNLLTNAVKFTPAGGQIEVQLGGVSGGYEAFISVRDDGEGISAEFLPHVFERFRQADNSTTRRQGGLGLGLAIVRHLVQLHGGRVSVHSPGRGLGTTFTVWLPLREVTPSIPKPTGRFLIAEALLQDLTVVLIDDDDDGREVLSLALESKGCRVMSMGSVAEAMAWMTSAEGTPDLILTDLSMPEEDGFSLLQRVRALPDTRGTIPVLAVSALRAEEAERRAVSHGFAGYIQKPVDCDTLVGTIARVVFSARHEGQTTLGGSGRPLGPTII